MTLEERIKHVAELKERAAFLKEHAEQAAEAFAKAQDELWDYMDAQNITSIKIDGRNHVRRGTIYGSINDKQRFVAWAQEHAPELLAPEPRKKLINELVRQRIDNNEPLPDGVTWHVRKYVGR